MRTDELRDSVSWKAYCFADDAERHAWATHADDLTLDRVLGVLRADLDRDGVATDGLRDADLGRLLIERYIRFPSPAT